MGLILRRQAGETIVIRPPGGQSQEIILTVYAVSGGRTVSIDIDAPEATEIWRGELLDTPRPAG